MSKRNIPLTTPGWTLGVPDDWQPLVVPIDKLNVKQWTDALRSGEHKQGQGYLHNSLGYCCMGVLCEKQGRPFQVIRQSYQLSGEMVDVWEFDGDKAYLNHKNPALKVISRAGRLPHEFFLEWVNGSRQIHNLADANDTGLAFADIATVIELIWTNEQQPNQPSTTTTDDGTGSNGPRSIEIMTKKHFEAIANAINRLRNRPDESALETIVIDEVVVELAKTFIQFNPNFNIQRFIDACQKPPK